MADIDLRSTRQRVAELEQKLGITYSLALDTLCQVRGLLAAAMVLVDREGMDRSEFIAEFDRQTEVIRENVRKEYERAIIDARERN